jgi:hypothetical protein
MAEEKIRTGVDGDIMKEFMRSWFRGFFFLCIGAILVICGVLFLSLCITYSDIFWWIVVIFFAIFIPFMVGYKEIGE